MISIDVLIPFFAASLLLGVAPGPDNIFVLTQSVMQGRFAGVIVTFGLCTGLIFHTTAVALGVAAVVMTSAIAFTILKTIGAAYLLYLAWGAFRAPVSKLEDGKGVALTGFQLYRRGIIMNITNPKVSIFFLAFLPQFVSPEKGSVPIQMILLGCVFIVATLIVFNSVALLAGTIGEWLRKSSKAQLVMNKVTAFLFAGLAVKLLTSQR